MADLRYVVPSLAARPSSVDAASFVSTASSPPLSLPLPAIRDTSSPMAFRALQPPLTPLSSNVPLWPPPLSDSFLSLLPADCVLPPSLPPPPTPPPAFAAPPCSFPAMAGFDCYSPMVSTLQLLPVSQPLAAFRLVLLHRIALLLLR